MASVFTNHKIKSAVWMSKRKMREVAGIWGRAMNPQPSGK